MTADRVYNWLNWGAFFVAWPIGAATGYYGTALIVQLAFQVGLLAGYMCGHCQVRR